MFLHNSSLSMRSFFLLNEVSLVFSSLNTNSCKLNITAECFLSSDVINTRNRFLFLHKSSASMQRLFLPKEAYLNLSSLNTNSCKLNLTAAYYLSSGVINTRNRFLFLHNLYLSIMSLSFLYRFYYYLQWLSVLSRTKIKQF